MKKLFWWFLGEVVFKICAYITCNCPIYVPIKIKLTNAIQTGVIETQLFASACTQLQVNLKLTTQNLCKSQC